MKTTTRLALALFLVSLSACASHRDRHAHHASHALRFGYLEIVTPDVDAACQTLARLHGVTFSEPVAALGGARTARLVDGGRLGVRAPLAAHEEPLVRPYLLVEDAAAAIAQAEAAGAEIAHPPLELPGEGTFAIYVLGGVQVGVWMESSGRPE